MKKLSTATVQTVKKMLPDIREKIGEEYKEWTEYQLGSNFYSDEKVLELLPSSFHEFIVIYRKIYTDREWAIYCLNDITKERMTDVITIALKRLALIDHSLANYESRKTAGTQKAGKRSKVAI